MLCEWLLSGGRSMLGTAAPGSGAGRFVDDVPVPGSLEAAFVRSAFAHPQSLAVGRPT